MSGSGGGKLIALGAAAGVCLALLLRKPAVDQRASAERSAPAANATPPVEPSAASSPSATPVAAVMASTSASSAPDQAASGAATVPRVPPPAEVADLAELKTAEIRCYQKDAEACFQAASAYAAGKLVPADEARAQNYRKVELTQLFRQCEKAAVRPCLVLAERYAKGDGLPLDVKKAEKLVKHVREVCQRRPAPGCELLGAAVR